MHSSDRFENATLRSSGDESEQERQFRAVLSEAYPSLKPSAELRGRIAERVAERAAACRQPAHPRWKPLGIGLGLAAAAAAAAFLIALAPTLVAARALRRMESAITDVRSANLVIWNLAQGGRRTKVREIWYQAGRWRIENVRPREVQVFAEGKLWRYEPETRKVTVRKAAGPAAYNPSGFTLTAMKRDHARWGWGNRLRMLDRTSVDGRLVHQLIRESAHQPERSLLLVDAATDLPVRTEVQREIDGRWVTETVVQHQYNERLPERLFRPEFGNSTRVSDLDAGRRLWRQRLAKGIARRRVEQRPIVIRDLKVNGEGDVFILYTASKSPGGVYGDWELDLTDEFGSRYLPGTEFQPFEQTTIPGHWAGYRFDREKLKGRWWALLTPQRPWKPRRFTLTFHVVPINHRYIHLKRQGKPLPENADYSIKTAFRIRVDQPTADLLPEWMPHMACPLSEESLQTSRLLARARFYRNEHNSQRNLPRALGLYQEVARLGEERARAGGAPPRDPYLWIDIGEVLNEMGRKQDARTAFERALRASSNDYGRRHAQKMMERLQAEKESAPGSR